MNLSKYSRREAHDVKIGDVMIGSGHPIAVQSMTNTPTADTELSVAQVERIADAGAGIVRLTAQGRKEGENLENIVSRLRADGYSTAVVADIHFVPEVASIAARYVDKVRINPGNYRTSNGELEALIAQCRERGVALRIGVNHGSLAKRIFDEWGDTPQGMVVSAMEFLRVCRRENFDQVVVSMKSSNTRVMVQAYRLLVEAMAEEGMTYPVHLGVTEAGNGIEGRVKSAVGIGALLSDGIGDTSHFLSCWKGVILQNFCLFHANVDLAISRKPCSPHPPQTKSFILQRQPSGFLKVTRKSKFTAY